MLASTNDTYLQWESYWHASICLCGRAQEELRSQSEALQAAEETASVAADHGQRLEPLLTETRRAHINTEAALFRPVLCQATVLY